MANSFVYSGVDIAWLGSLQSSEGAKMKLRNYLDSDWPKLLKLMKVSGIYYKHYDSRKMIKKKIEADPESIIIIENKEKLVSCVFIIYDPWSSYIYHLGVHPDYQGRGLGNKLMDEAERILKMRGTNPITIFVRENNSEALGFYRKRGYKGKSKCYDLEKKL